ncbi:hypothetical protein [uncultured Photobacterium sp.]|uniref:hypothetical protein n=1 Tax=uncultured Photobacterium sp. TaxID=173973 RepID=UPI00260F44D0|nr:hypothetical protein [uncultured Photobacterium sp.]
MAAVSSISYQSQCGENRPAIIAVCSMAQTKFVANFAPKFPKFSSRNWLSHDDGFYAGCGYLLGGHKVSSPL